MADRETVVSALHCRCQDLMIDLPACDKCDYQIQMVNRMGCDYRRICKYALALLKEQPEIIRCKDCKHSEPWYGDKSRCFLWHETGIDVFNDGFCNYGERKEDR